MVTIGDWFKLLRPRDQKIAGALHKLSGRGTPRGLPAAYDFVLLARFAWIPIRDLVRRRRPDRSLSDAFNVACATAN
jgi:hypothetical protein